MSVIEIRFDTGMLTVLDDDRVIPALRTWKAPIALHVPAIVRRLTDA